MPGRVFDSVVSTLKTTMMAVVFLTTGWASFADCPRALSVFLKQNEVQFLTMPLPLTPGVTNAVVVAYVDEAGRTLFARRTGEVGKGLWGLIGGKADPGESILQTALRETKEEVGISGHGFELTSIDVHVDAPRSKIYRVYTLIARPVGEARILEDRHSDMAWLDPQNLPQDVFETRPGLLQKLADEIIEFHRAH